MKKKRSRRRKCAPTPKDRKRFDKPLGVSLGDSLASARRQKGKWVEA